MARVEIRTQQEAIDHAKQLTGEYRAALNDLESRIQAARSLPTVANEIAADRAQIRAANLRVAISRTLHMVGGLPLGRDIRKPATGG